MRKTKIVATLGPATDREGVLRELLLAGVDVVRFNFSHGEHAEQLHRVSAVKALRDELNIPLALLADTRGPEIRIGSIPNGPVMLNEGQNLTLTTDKCEGTETRVSITYAGLPAEVKPGDMILIDDGLVALRVERADRRDIVTVVLNSGEISSHKGVNVPGVSLQMPFIAARDRSDLRFAVENGFDYIAASFTRCADDVREMREELFRLGGKHIKIIAKIENAEGVANVDSILAEADGLMVARGDMGVEIALEELPGLQKQLIRDCVRWGKPVITATQMLESMTEHPRPTRAEVTDVANAIYDNTSAIMLSGETAKGKYPVEAVKTMVRIAERAESNIHYRWGHPEILNKAATITNAISHSTCSTAAELQAAAIITVTKSGSTARHIAKYRPACPVIGCTPNPVVRHQLALVWGVMPVLMNEETDSERLMAHAVDAAVKNNLLRDGDLTVLTAGLPLGKSGTTNLIRVHVVGDKI